MLRRSGARRTFLTHSPKLSPEQQWNGEGMVVVRAASQSEAETIAREDPIHACGGRAVFAFGRGWSIWLPSW